MGQIKRRKMTKEEKEQLKKSLDNTFSQISKAFDETFKSSDAIFKSPSFANAEKKMRDSEARLRQRMDDTAARIRRRRAKINESVGNYDFTNDIDQITKRVYKSRTLVLGALFFSIFTLFAIMISIIFVSSQNETKPQPLSPSALEETIEVDPERKL